jgi:hypothetical protein
MVCNFPAPESPQAGIPHAMGRGPCALPGDPAGCTEMHSGVFAALRHESGAMQPGSLLRTSLTRGPTG